MIWLQAPPADLNAQPIFLEKEMMYYYLMNSAGMYYNRSGGWDQAWHKDRVHLLDKVPDLAHFNALAGTFAAFQVTAAFLNENPPTTTPDPVRCTEERLSIQQKIYYLTSKDGKYYLGEHLDWEPNEKWGRIAPLVDLFADELRAKIPKGFKAEVVCISKEAYDRGYSLRVRDDDVGFAAKFGLTQHEFDAMILKPLALIDTARRQEFIDRLGRLAVEYRHVSKPQAITMHMADAEFICKMVGTASNQLSQARKCFFVDLSAAFPALKELYPWLRDL